ncbi:AfsR/SARP family transcriptional regulator [Streptomyces sp. NPDC005811]|uniref:AfsR/SARP family transcriptional regulator n=1 Tax=Streptomyces sp. NPDC005811 TaxID=3154565 RepID=UPI003409521B
MAQMSFGVLGALQVRRDGAALPVGPPRQRSLLALLLARAGEATTLHEVVDVLWSESPPLSAVNLVRRYVGELRRLLEPGLPTLAAGRWLLGQAGTYRLAIPDDHLDLVLFRRLRAEARDHCRQGEYRQGAERYVQGLLLWRGPAAADVPSEVRCHPVFGALDRERLATAKDAADAALRAGCGELVVDELYRIADYHPLDEALQAKLMTALTAAGNRAEAVAVYAGVRGRLREDLGIGPGPELRAALRAATAPAATAPAAAPAATAPAAAPAAAGAGAAVTVVREHGRGARQALWHRSVST